MKCALCGYEFTGKEMGEGKCRTCPFTKGCNLICCPNCGYSFVDPSGTTAGIIKRLFEKGRKDGKRSDR
ncbi:MAG TPA: hypothetical protein EYP53_09900 [Candidatus Latescibacteria bacterium]|nr:hypothetical protein [Candidatus Latescibacterota bacterium]